jgi:hypothetical protein
MEYANLRVASLDDEPNVTDRGAGFAWHIAVTWVHACHLREKYNVPVSPVCSSFVSSEHGQD